MALNLITVTYHKNILRVLYSMDDEANYKPNLKLLKFHVKNVAKETYAHRSKKEKEKFANTAIYVPAPLIPVSVASLNRPQVKRHSVQSLSYRQSEHTDFLVGKKNPF
jgi:hypothetical protein